MACRGHCDLRPAGAAGRSVTAFAVAAYITRAYRFAASTSFANPAVTMSRAITDAFAGIRSADVFGFILAQLARYLARAAVAPPSGGMIAWGNEHSSLLTFGRNRRGAKFLNFETAGTFPKRSAGAYGFGQ
jgi:hypothetical protein